jgi:ADP-heptose:LPS heptosyltransferase
VPGALAKAAPTAGMKVIDHTARLKDFSETAALVANLDLVISVDTAVAHLAAGMGRPSWILLRRAAGWRWRTEGGTSLWYPSARLFRQTSEGDWSSVVAAVAAALGELAAQRVGRAA